MIISLVVCASCVINYTSCGWYRWNEWLAFPMKYRDLLPSSQLVFTVWDVTAATTLAASSVDTTNSVDVALTSIMNPPPLGGTTLRLFNKFGYILKQNLGNFQLLLSVAFLSFCNLQCIAIWASKAVPLEGNTRRWVFVHQHTP